MEITMKDTTSGLALLRKPFPANQISKLPKETKAQQEDKAARKKCNVCGGFHHPNAVHLDYVGHAALTDRLLDADINWTWEPMAHDEFGLPKFDTDGGLWVRLTVCGQTRIGYGNAEKSSWKSAGDREKEVIGDALRNAAMRFGAALELWHKGDLHADEEPTLTQSAVVDLVTSIRDATTLDELKHAYGTAVLAAGTDKGAVAAIIKAKDERKAQLTEKVAA